MAVEQEAGETMQETRDAMAAMMAANTKMLQAFIEVQINVLRLLHSGLDDLPATPIDLMTKTARALADATRNGARTA